MNLTSILFLVALVARATANGNIVDLGSKDPMALVDFCLQVRNCAGCQSQVSVQGGCHWCQIDLLSNFGVCAPSCDGAIEMDTCPAIEKCMEVRDCNECKEMTAQNGCHWCMLDEEADCGVCLPNCGDAIEIEKCSSGGTTSKPPVTRPPETEPPMTEAPVTRPPPVTQPPVTEAPPPVQDCWLERSCQSCKMVGDCHWCIIDQAADYGVCATKCQGIPEILECPTTTTPAPHPGSLCLIERQCDKCKQVPGCRWCVMDQGECGVCSMNCEGAIEVSQCPTTSSTTVAPPTPCLEERNCNICKTKPGCHWCQLDPQATCGVCTENCDGALEMQQCSAKLLEYQETQGKLAKKQTPKKNPKHKKSD